MSEECQVHHKKIPCEDCKAEELKKLQLYDPCGCSGAECDGCSDRFECQPDEFNDDSEPDWEDEE